MEHEVRQISDEGRREIAKELREQFFCCQYAEEFTEGLYFWLSRIETPDRLINAHIRIFENEISGEFFAFNGSILVGPCESAERVARECNCFIRMREVNSYNARKSGGSDGE